MTPDAAPPPGRCPHCGGPVGCGIGSTTPCWCTTVPLDPPARAELARRFDGCLCRTCLESWRPHAADGRIPAAT